MERACRPSCGLQAGAASGEDEDRLLQGCEPARRLSYHLVRRSGFSISSPDDDLEWKGGPRLHARRQSESVDGHQPNVRRGSLHHRSDKSLQELAEMYNPCIRGWITYYSHLYKARLRPALKRIDAYVDLCHPLEKAGRLSRRKSAMVLKKRASYSKQKGVHHHLAGVRSMNSFQTGSGCQTRPRSARARASSMPRIVRRWR